MGWLVGGVWLGAAMLAIVVLAFCAYEVLWKSRRLRRETARLQSLGERAQALQSEAVALQQRAARER